MSIRMMTHPQMMRNGRHGAGPPPPENDDSSLPPLHESDWFVGVLQNQ